METIRVALNAAAYDILIGNGLFQQAGCQLRRLTTAARAVVVSDETVAALYGQTLLEQMEAAGFAASMTVIPAGEASKSLAMLEKVYQGFAAARVSRGDLVVALGGGVVGDLTGFAAATYLRGVPYVQIPTTLLAQIDSSVGGKTAINLPQGKNLAGAFYQPAAVLIDPGLLDSLPQPTLREGLAEALKYGAIADRGLFERIAACRSRDAFFRQAPALIAACCRIKRDVVEEDEKDHGRRLHLNFGHSIGHAIEQVYNFQTYSHGEAVAIGMVKITEGSEQRGFSRPGTAAAIREALAGLGLPVTTPDWDREALLAAMALDKKNTGDKLRLIVLPQLGTAEIIAMSLEEAAAAFL
ncbi:MAG: 3-dehydroquinate synthase [Sporomusaceae bacterium]|nr:3-dehydroquinate synthase [Sporomusaceae bacterium]